MSYTRAKLRHKLRGDILQGYVHTRAIRGRTVDMFVYRAFGRWTVLHYPSGLVMGCTVVRPKRCEAVETIAAYLSENVSDYLLDQADRRPDPGKYFGWPYEAA